MGGTFGIHVHVDAWPIPPDAQCANCQNEATRTPEESKGSAVSPDNSNNRDLEVK